jgi:hypothetical protein
MACPGSMFAGIKFFKTCNKFHFAPFTFISGQLSTPIRGKTRAASRRFAFRVKLMIGFVPIKEGIETFRLKTDG